MHAIAVAIVHGPAKGLELGDALKVDAASLIITAWTPFELICWKRHHWIVGPAPEWIVERQNLRPIGIFGTGGFVVNCADSGLQLVYAD